MDVKTQGKDRVRGNLSARCGADTVKANPSDNNANKASINILLESDS